MNAQTLFNWTQIVTGVAVLLGLSLVVWELQQTRTLMRVQLLSEGVDAQLSNYRARLGENPAPILTKACFSPDELTPEETYVALMDNLITRRTAERNWEIEQIADLGVVWEGAVSWGAQQSLSSKLGRLIYEAEKEGLPPERRKLVEELLAQGAIFKCEDGLNQMMAALKSGSDPR